MTNYRAAPGLNFSTLRLAAKSLLHYRHALDNPPRETDAMRLGSLTHALILTDEPALDVLQRERCAIWEGARRGKAWKAFKAEHAGDLVITLRDVTRADEMRRAVRERAGDVLAGLAFEVELFWQHTETGARLKGRVDGMARGRLVELKTTARIDSFGREAAARLYHAQAGFYAHGMEATTGTFPAVTMIAVESTPPHDVAVYDVGEDDLVRGYRMCEDWIRRVIEAERTGRWPGVAPERTTLEIPAWAYAGEDAILPEDEESEDDDG